MGSVFATSPTYDVTFSRSDILMSDDVIDRLKKQQRTTEQPPVVKAVTPSVPEPAIEIVKPPPPPTPIEPAIKAAQQLSHSLDEVERKYEARLRKVEERNDNHLKAAQEEFTRVVDRLEAKYLKGSSEGCCTGAQKVVQDCYNANGSRSLNCSKEVDAFVRCVAAFRSARTGRINPEAL